MLSGLVHAQGKADDDGKEVEQEANRSRLVVTELLFFWGNEQEREKEREKDRSHELINIHDTTHIYMYTRHATLVRRKERRKEGRIKKETRASNDVSPRGGLFHVAFTRVES